MAKVRILGEVDDRYTRCGDKVVKVAILDKSLGRRKIGYILLGVSLPSGYETTYDDDRIKSTVTEAFHS